MDTVFDIGAHKGEDSAFYLSLGLHVVAVEANPELAGHLRQRFSKEIAEGSFVLLDKAIGDGRPVTFYVNQVESVWGTTNPEWAERNERLGAPSESLIIPSVRFPDILQQYGCPVYLKVDVEGADMLCVEGLKQASTRPRFLSIESNKTSWAGLKREFDTLEALGYTRFKVIDQRHHKAGEFITRTGGVLDHEFEEGASGPFGDMLPGKWLTRKQALRRYALIFALYRTVGDNTLIERIAKRTPFVRRLVPLVGWYDTHAQLSD